MNVFPDDYAETVRRAFQEALKEVNTTIDRGIEKLDQNTDPEMMRELLRNIRDQVNGLDAEYLLAWTLAKHLQRYSDHVKLRSERVWMRDKAILALCRAGLREAYQLGWWSYDRRGPNITWAPSLEGMLAMLDDGSETPLARLLRLLIARESQPDA